MTFYEFFMNLSFWQWAGLMALVVVVGGIGGNTISESIKSFRRQD